MTTRVKGNGAMTWRRISIAVVDVGVPLCLAGFVVLYSQIKRYQMIGLDDGALGSFARLLYFRGWIGLALPALAAVFTWMRHRRARGMRFVGMVGIRCVLLGAVLWACAAVVTWEGVGMPTFHGMKWHYPGVRGGTPE